MIGALFEAEDDKCKRALLQDTVLLIMFGGRHLYDLEALLDVFTDQKCDFLWRFRFHNSFVKLVGPSLWPLKKKIKNTNRRM